MNSILIIIELNHRTRKPLSPSLCIFFEQKKKPADAPNILNYTVHHHESSNGTLRIANLLLPSTRKIILSIKIIKNLALTETINYIIYICYMICYFLQLVVSTKYYNTLQTLYIYYDLAESAPTTHEIDNRVNSCGFGRIQRNA